MTRANTIFKVMFCQMCGTKLRADARFCKRCGESVEDPEEEPRTPMRIIALRGGDAMAAQPTEQPWIQNEDAVILPITRELVKEERPPEALDAVAQIVPVTPANTAPSPIAPPEPIETLRQTCLIGNDKLVDSAEGLLRTETTEAQSLNPAKEQRRTRIFSALLLLLLAVFFLFWFAYAFVK